MVRTLPSILARHLSASTDSSTPLNNSLLDKELSESVLITRSNRHPQNSFMGNVVSRKVVPTSSQGVSCFSQFSIERRMELKLPCVLPAEVAGKRGWTHLWFEMIVEMDTSESLELIDIARHLTCKTMSD